MGRSVLRERSDIRREKQPHGIHRWICDPDSTSSEALTIVEVELEPGKSHDFHMHPDQEEVIYVICGEIEQWIEGKKKKLRTGEAAYIEQGVFHASINRNQNKARFLAIFGPSVGPNGATTVDASEHEVGRQFVGKLEKG